MRVTNGMLVSNSIWNINNNTRRLEKAQQQEATQSKIQLPSDDPEVATQAVKYRNYVSTLEQYQKNVNDAVSWMKVTEGALSDLHDVIREVSDKTVQAAGGAISDSDLAAIKQDVLQLKKTAIQILNTSYAGRYIFAGYATDKEPFAETTLASGATTVDKVTYKGKIVNLNGPVPGDLNMQDYAEIYKTNKGNAYQPGAAAQSMKYDIGFDNQLVVNVEGQDLVGTSQTANLFVTFDKLLIGLNGKTSYITLDESGTPVKPSETSFHLTDVLGDLDHDLDRIAAVTANLGARENTANIAVNRLGDDHTVYTKLMSKNEDMDAVAATTNVAAAKAVYEASLAGAAKAIGKSLLDYIG
jgi:flagellar hook-associated protein 3 FlgL